MINFYQKRNSKPKKKKKNKKTKKEKVMYLTAFLKKLYLKRQLLKSKDKTGWKETVVQCMWKQKKLIFIIRWGKAKPPKRK